MNDSLDNFILSLIKEKGITVHNDAMLEVIKTDLTSQLLTVINVTILEHLPDEKIPEFRELVEHTDSEEEIESFYQYAIPDFEILIQETLLDFKYIYLGYGNRH